MPEFITPTVRLRESWLASRHEWGRDVHQDGAGLRADDVVDSVAGFALWVGRLLRQADTPRPVSEDRVHASYWWIVEDGTYLGAITLRHELNDFLLRAAGHIGYGIRPSARGRGLATWALRSVLVRAPALGLRKVLVTCGDSNLASARVIEKAGGVLETCATPNSASPAVTGSPCEPACCGKTAGDIGRRDSARSPTWTHSDQQPATSKSPAPHNDY